MLGFLQLLRILLPTGTPQSLGVCCLLGCLQKLHSSGIIPLVPSVLVIYQSVWVSSVYSGLVSVWAGFRGFH